MGALAAPYAHTHMESHDGTDASEYPGSHSHRLPRRRPEFYDLDDFVEFARLVRCGVPGVSSTTARQTEMIELGTIVQTPGPAEPRPPSTDYHIEWLKGLLRDAVRRVDADRSTSREAVQCFVLREIGKQRIAQISKKLRISESTVSRRAEAGKEGVIRAIEVGGYWKA